MSVWEHQHPSISRVNGYWEVKSNACERDALAVCWQRPICIYAHLCVLHLRNLVAKTNDTKHATYVAEAPWGSCARAGSRRREPLKLQALGRQVRGRAHRRRPARAPAGQCLQPRHRPRVLQRPLCARVCVCMWERVRVQRAQ